MVQNNNISGKGVMQSRNGILTKKDSCYEIFVGVMFVY